MFSPGKFLEALDGTAILGLGLLGTSANFLFSCYNISARMGKTKNAHRSLMGNPKGKRQIGRPKCRWGYNTKMHLKVISWDRNEWIDTA
jgi:hypothetical protein